MSLLLMFLLPLVPCHPSPRAFLGEPGEHQAKEGEHQTKGGEHQDRGEERQAIRGERQARGYFQHKTLGSPRSYHYSSRVHRPSVNYVANGRPYKVLINPRDQKKQTTTRAPHTPTSSLVASTSPSIPPTSSPLTWLTNNFFFNGRLASLVAVPSGWPAGGWRWN